MARTFGVNLRASRDTNQAMVEEPIYMCGFSTIVGNWEGRWGVSTFRAYSARKVDDPLQAPPLLAQIHARAANTPGLIVQGPPAPAPVFYPERPHGFRPRHAQRLRPD